LFVTIQNITQNKISIIPKITFNFEIRTKEFFLLVEFIYPIIRYQLEKVKMIKAILLTITFALFVSAEFRTNFGVTYPKNSNLPSSEKDAISAKWIKIGTFASCGSKYISPNKDITNMLIFDQQGGIAGIEVGKHSKPEEPMLSRYYEEGTFEGKTYYSLTGYFVDPKAICGQRTAGKYGDRVWWKSNDSSFIKLPLSQAEAEKDPNWVIGTCILGMGIHYW
jgi:hypothetical protein